MKDDIKSTKRDFNPDLYILHAGTNDLSSEESNTEIAGNIMKVAEMLKPDHNSVAISTIVPHADNFKEKVNEVKKILVLKSRQKDIPLISRDNINLKRHLN